MLIFKDTDDTPGKHLMCSLQKAQNTNNKETHWIRKQPPENISQPSACKVINTQAVREKSLNLTIIACRLCLRLLLSLDKTNILYLPLL